MSSIMFTMIHRKGSVKLIRMHIFRLFFAFILVFYTKHIFYWFDLSEDHSTMIGIIKNGADSKHLEVRN